MAGKLEWVGNERERGITGLTNFKGRKKRKPFNIINFTQRNDLYFYFLLVLFLLFFIDLQVHVVSIFPPPLSLTLPTPTSAFFIFRKPLETQGFGSCKKTKLDPLTQWFSDFAMY